MKICFNGQFLADDAPVITGKNRGFKWGDGVFETMKVYEGRLLLATLHFERLFLSLQLLQIEKKNLEENNLVRNILRLCSENNCNSCARVRLAVYREDDNTAGYVIEAMPLSKDFNGWQEHGLTIGLYPFARKATDAFANIKSANFLPYVLAKKYADENSLDDAILLNTYNRICDSSRANIFLIKEKQIYTPSLHEGCVNGIMRRVVMEEVKKLGYRMHYDEVREEQLLEADEVFLTNAIQTVRWVRNYKHRNYHCTITQKIFDAARATIFS